MTRSAKPRGPYLVLLWIAFTWAVVNCVYVYGVGQGTKPYRVESAVLILVAVSVPSVLRIRAAVTTPERLRTPPILGVAAVFAWVAIVSPLVSLPFLSDDYVFLDLYRDIADIWHVHNEFFRPGFALVFFVLRRLGGDSPQLFHVVSYALHLGSAYLIYSLTQTVYRSSSLALIAASCFLLNPVQLEAVAWASGLQELLWTFFVLLALRGYVEPMSPRRFALVIVLVAAALSCKETAVSFALLLPGTDILLGRSRDRRAWSAWGILAAVLVGYFLVRSVFVTFEQTYFFWPSRYFLKEFLVAPYSVFAQPWNTKALQLSPVFLGIAALVIVGLFFAAVISGRVGRRLLLGPVIMLASTLPLGAALYVGADLIASRYVYFAAFGWGCVLTEMIGAVCRKPTAIAGATVILIATLTSALYLNARPWKTVGPLVESITHALQDGKPIDAAVAQWQQTHHGLTLKDGVPYDYQGVGVFINGFPELTHHIAAGRR